MTSELAHQLDAGQLEALERAFYQASVEQTHPRISEWRRGKFEAGLREAWKGVLASLIDDRQAEQFAEAMHVLRLPASSFKSRLITIDGVQLIAAINFRDVGGDTPYIRVLRSTALLGIISDWSALKYCFSETFHEFNPEAVLFFHPSHSPLHAPTTGIYDHVLAAPAGSMTRARHLDCVERVDLRQSANLDFYPKYVSVYEELYRDRPALRGEVRVETEASLSDCLQAGFLFEVFVDGAWAGVVAADRRTVAGIRGVYMIEIVLAKRARGQKLGAAIHQQLARAIAKHDPSEIILGTISAKNPWSRSAALAAGRIEIGAWHWVDLRRST